jgi:hypothetical protein
MYVIGLFFGDILRYFRERREAQRLEALAAANHRELIRVVEQCERKGISVSDLPFDLLTGADKGADTDTSFQFKLLNVAPYYIGKYKELLLHRAAKSPRTQGPYRWPLPVVSASI